MQPEASPQPISTPSACPSETRADEWWLAELSCWTVVVLAPLLRWINGPAVSTDQFVVRTALVCLALLGAVSLRTLAIVRAVRHHRSAPPSGSA